MNNHQNVQQMYDNIPFKEPNDKFDDVLYNEYILKSIDWIDKASGDVAFAQNFGCNWEAAYILEYLLDVRKIAKTKNDQKCITKSESMSYSIVSFLLSDEQVIPVKQRENYDRKTGKWMEQKHRTNWDGNTWDTSVVCNSLLYFIDEFGDDKSFKNDPRYFQIWLTLPLALKWLYDQFDNNRTQYSQYSFGSIDYSRILMLFIFVIKSQYCNSILSKSNLNKKDLIRAIHDLAKYVDKEKVSDEIEIYNDTERKLKKETILNWGDCFITAEICDAMSHYINFLEANKLKNNHDIWIKEVYETLKRAMRSVEVTQSSEGMWGAHDDTIRCLSSYLTTISELKSFEKIYQKFDTSSKHSLPEWIKGSDYEEHKVFKAIRWLFDPKQRFSDGSYLHTSFLSVFMFEAYIAINNHWDFAKNKTIYKIYDEVFWMSPARTTQEKGQVVELEIEQENKLMEIRKLKNMTKSMGLGIVVIAVIVVFFILSGFLGLLEISVILNDKITDVGEMMSLTFAIIVFVITTIYLSKKGED